MSSIQAQIEDPAHIVVLIDSTSYGIPAYAMIDDWFVGMTQAGDFNLCKLGVSIPVTITMRRPDQTTYILSVGNATVSFWGSRPTRP